MSRYSTAVGEVPCSLVVNIVSKLQWTGTRNLVGLGPQVGCPDVKGSANSTMYQTAPRHFWTAQNLALVLYSSPDKEYYKVQSRDMFPVLQVKLRKSVGYMKQIFALCDQPQQAESSEVLNSSFEKKFPVVYTTRWFITALTEARNLSLSWTSWIHPYPFFLCF